MSVHPARRRRTHSITVTVRNAHSMASSSTSESDSLPVSSACKAQRWYKSQSRRLNNEGEKIFPHFARTDRRYTPLRTAFRSASPKTKLLPTALHSTSTPFQHSYIRPCPSQQVPRAFSLSASCRSLNDEP